MNKFQCIIAIYFDIYILCAKASQSNNNSSLYRLPKDIIPESYDILLLTNVTKGDFHYKGLVTINLQVIHKTNRVIVHSEYLTINKDETIFRRILPNNSIRTIQISNQRYELETHFYIIQFSSALTPGKYLLSLQFDGEVLNDIFGFYRSRYRVKNEIRWIGVTQFSPTFARRAFPCMDEPGFKATFQLHIGHNKNETVSSNTLGESRQITDDPSYYVTTFKKTPRMSTYLVSWAIHGFQRINSSEPCMWLWTKHNDSEIIRSLASTPALIEGPKIYAALQDLFVVKNPLRKIEHFPVPDFNFNAMENWGLVTFRESVLFVRPGETPTRQMRTVHVTLAHEYAHTWFGNIVTPESWSFGWLKEGFATYFSYYILAQMHKDWHMMTTFTLDVFRSCLLPDSMDHDKVMNRLSIVSSKSAEGALDYITYDKAASIIRMISEVMGNKVFKNAIHSYLKDKQFAAVSPADLYKHFELHFNSSDGAKKIPVALGDFIESWANQTNYPLVTASRIAPGHLYVTQEPFRLNRTYIESASRFWWIPLSVITPTESKDKQFAKAFTWLGAQKIIDLELPEGASNDDWFLLNTEQVGYYRVDYDQSNWNALMDVLNSDNMHQVSALNRAALIDDAFNLARAGRKEYGQALKLVEYLPRESDYEPWAMASKSFRFLDKKLMGKLDIQLEFRRFATSMLSKIYKTLSFVESPLDSELKKMHRNLILETACALNLDDCVLNAKTIFSNWIVDERKSIPANLKSFVYCTGIHNGSNGQWIIMWERFLRTSYYAEKELMMLALACTENPAFINKYLGYCINPDTDLPKQYRLPIIQSIIRSSSKNIETTLLYLEKNLNQIIKTRGYQVVETILNFISQEIFSDEYELKFKEFVNRNSKELGPVLSTAFRLMKYSRNNIDWIETYAPKIANYLKPKAISLRSFNL